MDYRLKMMDERFVEFTQMRNEINSFGDIIGRVSNQFDGLKESVDLKLMTMEKRIEMIKSETKTLRH